MQFCTIMIMENDMDIGSVRLGFAYAALRQALGEDFAPISFAEHSLAFIDHRYGLTHFCTATREALWVSQIDSEGKVADGSDEKSLNVRARAEANYLALSRGFEKELDKAMSREARAAHEAYESNFSEGQIKKSLSPVIVKQEIEKKLHEVQPGITRVQPTRNTEVPQEKPWAPAMVRTARVPVKLGPAARNAIK